ncbi:Deoxyribonuclease-1-like 2 [Taenia crassiceps]|uniref:Deoxyribonuclease-1-like 2 n=1 Tax=Taenia crassiceps TaxID=6207 RepID=A0ABR4QAJ2_9CEST
MLSLPLLLLLVVCLLGLPAPSEEKVKVAGFNVQVFGKRKSKDSEVMDILAKIIGGYDGVFVQEIRDSSGKAFPELLNTVSAASGATYRGLMGPRKGRSSSKEQIGFVYRPDKIQLVGLFPMLNKSTSFERPPDCFAFIIKEGGLRVAVLAVHISPRSVKAEMEALYNVAPVCQTFAGTQNLILLGDMNADCGYLPARDRHKLRLRTDHQYKWLIEDGADTTVAASRCAYDRVIVKGDELARRTSSARPNNFEKVYKLPLSKTGHLHLTSHFIAYFTVGVRGACHHHLPLHFIANEHIAHGAEVAQHQHQHQHQHQIKLHHITRHHSTSHHYTTLAAVGVADGRENCLHVDEQMVLGPEIRAQPL